MENYNIDDRISQNDEDCGDWHQAHMEEKRRYFEELRSNSMSYALERYHRTYPKLTNFLLDQVKHYGIKDIYGVVCEDFEFCSMIIDELRDEIVDNGLFEAIEDDLKAIFITGNKDLSKNLLLGIKQHLYYCANNVVDCIIDECEDYIKFSYDDVLDQFISYQQRG